jgi:Protein of unknown function (DUF3455)
MTSPTHRAALLASAVLALAACAAPAVKAPTDIPAALAVPGARAPAVETLAVGVQIYVCEFSEGANPSGSWTFKSPEATLTDTAGRALGKHYAGPTWEALDGSSVVGQLRASAPAPDAGAIPWLALSVKSAKGKGMFAPVTDVLRVRTAGGVAPAQPCAAGNSKQVVRVPYTATYYFY